MSTHDAWQGTRYAEALAGAARDAQRRQATAGQMDDYERKQLARYVRQQVRSGAFEALVERTQRNSPHSNPYRLSAAQFEILDMGLAHETFGVGRGMGTAIAKLKRYGLIVNAGAQHGVYKLTDEGRRAAAGKAGRDG